MEELLRQVLSEIKSLKDGQERLRSEVSTIKETMVSKEG